MKTITLEDKYSSDLRELARLVRKSRKTVVLTGAGISRNAGIPDFRSSSGLYKQSTENGTVSCRDLFDVSVYRDVKTIHMFNKFMQKMYFDKVRQAKPTKTHRFIKMLKDQHKLMRCYTQNIDGLERQLGMDTEFDKLQNWRQLDVVQLHGDLCTLRCSRCRKSYQWDEIYVDEAGAREDAGLIIACPECQKSYDERKQCGKRCCTSSIGIIRPNIVLYGEEHPYGEVLAKNLEKDIARKPKLFLIFGTSLRVVGVKTLVRRMAQTVHENGGKVVIVNKDTVCQSSWGEYIDYQVVGDCDQWCEFIQTAKPAARKRQSKPSAAKSLVSVAGTKRPLEVDVDSIESPAAKQFKMIFV